jgi:hypothetical protein
LAILHPQELNPDQKSDLKRKLIEYFVDKELDPDLKVTSLHVQFQGQREKSEFIILHTFTIFALMRLYTCFLDKKDSQIECISGTPHITESLTDKKLKFAISPQAFFQVIMIVFIYTLRVQYFKRF